MAVITINSITAITTRGITMEYNTSELCDLYANQIDVLEPMFISFGGRTSYGGSVVTIKCFEAPNG